MSTPPYGPPPQQPPAGPPPGQPPYGGPPPGQPPYGGQPPGQPPYGYGPQPLSPSDERTWALVAHLGPPVLSLLSLGLLGFLTPLLIWLFLRDRSAYVRDQAKESLNFQITLLIGYVVGWITVFLLVGFVILLAVWVLSIVFGILAAVAVNRHEAYRYPLNIRLIS
ncbi:DUF4870 domain-containing protein [Isoptericola sp. NPDC058082]|uniref:DUF4870 domain-containing protein n=1 Tax=Isoptericola sp. NPDC058082 TaxID=3346331 RepID=UPI0036DFFEA1